MERSFKGIWIPKEIWLSEDLGWTEKFLLAEIDSLVQNNECFATNDYFGKFFNISKDRVSKIISSLSNKGFVEVKLIYKQGTKQVEKRIITTRGYRRKQLEGIGENNYTPIGENAEDINTSFNTTTNNTKEIYIPFSEIIAHLNEKAKTNYKPSSNKTKDLIKARWNEGFILDDFKAVIDKKSEEWLNDGEMCKYLRPETLFGTKFESYLNQKRVNENDRKVYQHNRGNGRPAKEKFEFFGDKVGRY